MNSHISLPVKPAAASPDHVERTIVTDLRGLPIVADWGLAATASAGAVRLEVDEALADDAYAATLMVGSTQLRFRMRERGTIAEVERFLAAGTASELDLGWKAVIARDPEFADRFFLRVGYSDAGVILTLTGQALADFATCASDVAGQLV